MLSCSSGIRAVTNHSTRPSGPGRVARITVSHRDLPLISSCARRCRSGVGKTLRSYRTPHSSRNRLWQWKPGQHFATLRSVNRYANALRLSLPPVAGTVDLVDFCVLEFLRVLYPKIYVSTFRHRGLLAIEPASIDTDAGEPTLLDQKRREWLEKVPTIDNVPSRLHDSLCDLLVASFPDLEDANLRRKSNGPRLESPDCYPRSIRPVALGEAPACMFTGIPGEVLPTQCTLRGAFRKRDDGATSRNGRRQEDAYASSCSAEEG